MGLVDLDNLKLGQGEDFPPSGEFMKLNTQQGQINWLAQAIDEVNEAAGGESYTLPAATADTLGGVKVGANLSITDDGVLSADEGESYTLPAATADTLGGVKVGANLSITDDGVLKVKPESGKNALVSAGYPLGSVVSGDVAIITTNTPIWAHRTEASLNLAGYTDYTICGDLQVLSYLSYTSSYPDIPHTLRGRLSIIPTSSTGVTVKTFEYGTSVEDEYLITIKCNSTLKDVLPSDSDYINIAIYKNGTLQTIGKAYISERTSNFVIKIALMAASSQTLTVTEGDLLQIEFLPIIPAN